MGYDRLDIWLGGRRVEEMYIELWKTITWKTEKYMTVLTLCR